MAAGRRRTSGWNFPLDPVDFLQNPATSLPAGVGEQVGKDGEVKPDILGPIPAQVVAGGGGGSRWARGCYSNRGGFRDREGERDTRRERERDIYIYIYIYEGNSVFLSKIPFPNIYDRATEFHSIVTLSLQLQFEPTTCLRTHLAVLYVIVQPEFPNSFRVRK
ncbi:unnamed protein product [Prunus armeniaca]